VVFHYTIRNVTGRAVRNGALSCSDRPITWEYRTEDGKWAAPAWRMDAPMVCNSNVYIETPLLPDGTLEGEFTLASRFPEYDLTRFRTAGDFVFLFTFGPNACIASPDARFCLTWPKKQEVASSGEVSVRFTAASPPNGQ